MISKKCFKCNIEWPLEYFYKHPRMSDGHVNKCKECNKRDVRENRANKIDYYTEYDKNRTQDPIRRASNRLYGRNAYINKKDEKKEYSKNYRLRFPEKYKAHCKLNNSLRDRKISKLPCKVCGELKVHAHHADYSKPLDVIWLCSVHHSLVHLD